MSELLEISSQTIETAKSTTDLIVIDELIKTSITNLELVDKSTLQTKADSTEEYRKNIQLLLNILINPNTRTHQLHQIVDRVVANKLISNHARLLSLDGLIIHQNCDSALLLKIHTLANNPVVTNHVLRSNNLDQTHKELIELGLA